MDKSDSKYLTLYDVKKDEIEFIDNHKNCSGEFQNEYGVRMQ
jgi:hypothetical protein